MRIHIIRHADPDYENDTITERGKREARALAQRMAAASLTAVYSSPLGRARATARYTEERTGLSASILPWAAELRAPHLDTLSDGSQPVWNVDGEVVRDRDVPMTTENWSGDGQLGVDDYRRIVDDVNRESDAFLEQFGYRRRGGVYDLVGRSDHENIAVFCHAGLAMTWLAHLLDLPAPLVWSGFFLAPTSVTVVLLEQRSREVAVPRVLTVGDTSHVYADGLSESRRGLLPVASS